MTIRINTHTSLKPSSLSWRQPISSTYLVMLRRYQDFLREKDADGFIEVEERSIEPLSNNELIENTISLNQLIPIFAELEQTIGHNAFGIDIGRHMHPSDYGIFGYAMMNCSSVGLALSTAAKHKAIRNRNMTASFFQSGGQFHYEILMDQRDLLLDMLVELDFSTAFQFGKLLVGPHREELVTLDGVHFKHAALGPVELYEERFGCPVYFEQDRNYVSLSPEVEELPIYAANPKILSMLENKIESIISKVKPATKSLSKRVHDYLNTVDLSHFPSSADVAETFNMSLSSFKKHLKDEETCFHDICEEARKERSLKLLTQDDLPIKSVAFELGFANPSAFNKAFKRWTGESPMAYRKAREVPAVLVS